MKLQIIKELIIFLYISWFDIKEWEVKLLEKFFFYKEIESVKKKKDKKLDKIEIDLINNTKEQDTVLNNKIELDKVGETDEEGEVYILLSKNNTQVQILGQKCKS